MSARDGNLHDQIVAAMRQQIVDGVIAVGSRIAEAKLCEQFGISRTPLREALKVLASEGLVRLQPNRGSVVAPIDPQEIGHIFELKGAIERQIGILANERATVHERDEIETVHGRLVTSAGSVDYTRLNQRFHSCMASATHNPVLCQTYDNFQHRILRMRLVLNVNAALVAESIREHEAIMVAFRARTPLDLADRLEAHNRRTAAVVKGALSMRREGHAEPAASTPFRQ